MLEKRVEELIGDFGIDEVLKQVIFHADDKELTKAFLGTLDTNDILAKVLSSPDVETRLKLHFADNVVHGVFLADRQKKLVYVNPAFEKLTGWNKEELVGMSILPDEMWFNQNDREEYVHSLDADGNVKKVLAYLKTRSGKPIPVGVSSTFTRSISSREKNLFGCQGIVQDYRTNVDAIFKAKLNTLIEAKTNILNDLASTEELDSIINAAAKLLPQMFHATYCSIYTHVYGKNMFINHKSNYEIPESERVVARDENSRSPINYAVNTNRPLVVLGGKYLKSAENGSRKYMSPDDINESTVLHILGSIAEERKFERKELEDLALEFSGSKFYQELDSFIVIPHSIQYPTKKLTGVIRLFGIREEDVFKSLNALGDQQGFGTAKQLIPEVFDEPEHAEIIHKHYQRLAEMVSYTIGSKIRQADLVNELRNASRTDHLTGMLNRRGFDDVVSREFSKARQKVERKNYDNELITKDCYLSMMMLDLDHFKDINDRYGHEIGDLLLKEVTDVMQGSLHRAGDTLARMGGEEIAFMLPETTSVGAAHVAERIRKNIQNHDYKSKGLPGVTATLGIATFPDIAASEYSSLLKKADDALYRGKRDGRNTVVVY